MKKICCFVSSPKTKEIVLFTYLRLRKQKSCGKREKLVFVESKCRCCFESSLKTREKFLVTINSGEAMEKKLMF